MDTTTSQGEVASRQPDIYNAAQELQVLFAKYLRGQRNQQDLIRQCQYHFLTWVSFLGVFAAPTASLDARLRESPDIKDLVLSMLSVVKRNLIRGTERHDQGVQEQSVAGGNNPDSVVRGITGALDRLHRLAVAIRQPMRTDEVARVQAFANKHLQDGFADIALAIINFRFSAHAPVSLCVQLATSIVYRRNRLLYQRQHNKKLRRDREQNKQDSGLDASSSKDPGTQVLVEERPIELGSHMSPRTELSPTEPSKRDYSHIRHILSSQNNGDELKPRTSSVRSSNPLISARYPTKPTVPDGQVDVLCPYCWNSLRASDLKSDKWWRSHVDDDLRTYVCIAKECGNLPPSFSTTREWSDHMHKEHGEDWAQHIYRDFHWLCLYDHDSPPQFSNAQSLRAHLAESHTTQFRSDQELDVIAERSKQSIALEAGFCPLCGDLVDAQTGSGDEPRDFGLQELKAQKKVSFQKEKQDRNSAAPSIETEALSECHDHAAGFGVTSVTLRRHIIEDLTTIAFYSLRWWDEHPGANEVASRDSISTGSIGSAAGKDSLLSENIVLDESTLNEMRETQRILGVQEERSALVVTNIPVVVTETQPHLQVSQYSRQSGRTTPENTPAKKATSDIAPIERSRAGLDDTRVTVCRDRGYHYHKQKHGHLYTSRFRGGPMLSGSTKDVVKMIRNELIDRASVSVMGGVSHRYLPHSQLRWILTRERIAFIIGSLTGFGELSDRERGNLVEEILEGGKQYCRKPCLKLLAASIRTDKGKSFSKLLKQRHATDGCLPPVWDWKGNVECHSCPKKHILFDVENTDSKEEFVKWTHILNAPYFTTPTEVGKKHTHYVLCEKDVLPVEERDAMRDDHNHDSRTSGRYGASSNVHMVKFHPEHYDLPHGTDGNKRPGFFALKQLNSHSVHEFNQELASLLTFQASDHQHIIQLLFSFEVQDGGSSTFYFVFPWADGNLWDLFQTCDSERLQPTQLSWSYWMVEQSHGLAVALTVVHNDRISDLQHMDSIPEDQKELYGIHGDIKSDNILWYRKDNRLVLTDFGLGQLHTKSSRSSGDPHKMGRTETYRAPEFDVPGGKVSRLSDIFSLGCLFLEFATWYLEGYRSAHDEFATFRLGEQQDMPGFKTDTFFRLEGPGKTPVITAEVKRWIKRLRENRRVNYLMSDYLDLIEHHMLVPEPNQRFSSDRIAQRLYVFSRTCQTDSSYYEELINIAPA